MKKRAVSLLLILMLVTVMVGGSVSSAMAATATIHLNKKSVTINEGMTQTIKLLTAKDKTIGASKVKWTSDNKKIASVSAKGVITAVAPGKTVIKAKYKGKTYKCNVTVRDVKLGTTKKTLYEGDTFAVKIKAGKTTVAASKATWNSSDEAVATVSEKGLITAVGKGTAKITAKYGKKTYTCNVTVNAVKMTVSDTEYYVGKTVKAALKAGSDVIPAEKITWSSSDETVATVSAEGEISLLDSGIATIYAEYGAKTYEWVVKATKLDVLKALVREQGNQAQFANEWTLSDEIFDASGNMKGVGAVLHPSGTLTLGYNTYDVMDFPEYLASISIYEKVSFFNNYSNQFEVRQLQASHMHVNGIPYDGTSIIEATASYDKAYFTKDTVLEFKDKPNGGFEYVSIVGSEQYFNELVHTAMARLETFLKEEAGLTLKDIGFYEYAV